MPKSGFTQSLRARAGMSESAPDAARRRLEKKCGELNRRKCTIEAAVVQFDDAGEALLALLKPKRARVNGVNLHFVATDAAFADFKWVRWEKGEFIPKFISPRRQSWIQASEADRARQLARQQQFLKGCQPLKRR